MQTATKNIRFKRKEMEVGDRVVLISDIENGLIKLKPFDEGSIIYLQNQVKATVWFRNIGHYATEPITKALQLDTSFYKNGKFNCNTVELKRESFAIKHRYNSDFEGIIINEDKALTIPFFVKNEEYRMPSSMH